MAKENGAPTAEEKGKGKAVDKPIDVEKKEKEIKKDKDGKPIKNGGDGKDLELPEGVQVLHPLRRTLLMAFLQRNLARKISS